MYPFWIKQEKRFNLLYLSPPSGTTIPPPTFPVHAIATTITSDNFHRLLTSFSYNLCCFLPTNIAPDTGSLNNQSSTKDEGVKAHFFFTAITQQKDQLSLTA